MIYIFIFILTLGDVFLTAYGVMEKKISEANPLFIWLFEYNAILAGFIVLLVVGLLIWFVSKQKFRWLKYACLGLVFVKIGVMFLHINWLAKI